MANARAKSEQAEQTANKARQDSDMARVKAKEFAPEFQQPGTWCDFMSKCVCHYFKKLLKNIIFHLNLAMKLAIRYAPFSS